MPKETKLFSESITLYITPAGLITAYEKESEKNTAQIIHVFGSGPHLSVPLKIKKTGLSSGKLSQFISDIHYFNQTFFNTPYMCITKKEFNEKTSLVQEDFETKKESELVFGFLHETFLLIGCEDVKENSFRAKFSSTLSENSITPVNQLGFSLKEEISQVESSEVFAEMWNALFESVLSISVSKFSVAGKSDLGFMKLSSEASEVSKVLQ